MFGELCAVIKQMGEYVYMTMNSRISCRLVKNRLVGRFG
jgi:hypothetical protein